MSDEAQQRLGRRPGDRGRNFVLRSAWPDRSGDERSRGHRGRDRPGVVNLLRCWRCRASIATSSRQRSRRRRRRTRPAERRLRRHMPDPRRPVRRSACPARPRPARSRSKRSAELRASRTTSRPSPAATCPDPGKATEQLTLARLRAGSLREVVDDARHRYRPSGLNRLRAPRGPCSCLEVVRDSGPAHAGVDRADASREWRSGSEAGLDRPGRGSTWWPGLGQRP